MLYRSMGAYNLQCAQKAIPGEEIILYFFLQYEEVIQHCLKDSVSYMDYIMIVPNQSVHLHLDDVILLRIVYAFRSFPRSHLLFSFSFLCWSFIRGFPDQSKEVLPVPHSAAAQSVSLLDSLSKETPILYSFRESEINGSA